MIAGYEDARRVAKRGEHLQVLERKVAGTEDDVGPTFDTHTEGQRLHDLVGHRQHTNHACQVTGPVSAATTVGAVSDAVTDRISEFLGERMSTQPQRASVTFLGVEPIEVLRFAGGDDVVYVTLGCARHPMSEPSDLHADPVTGPRAEVVVRLHASTPLPGLHKRMATVAAAPAVEGLILAPDALVDLSEPVWDGAAPTALLLELDDLGDLVLPEPMDPVRFLRAVPITANEAAWVRLKGADALREAWREAGIDVMSPERAAAKL